VGRSIYVESEKWLYWFWWEGWACVWERDAVYEGDGCVMEWVLGVRYGFSPWEYDGEGCVILCEFEFLKLVSGCEKDGEG